MNKKAKMVAKLPPPTRPKDIEIMRSMAVLVCGFVRRYSPEMRREFLSMLEAELS